MYIDIIFLDPRDNIPAKWGVCKELIDYDVIKKVLREEQLKEYDKYRNLFLLKQNCILGFIILNLINDTLIFFEN